MGLTYCRQKLQEGCEKPAIPFSHIMIAPRSHLILTRIPHTFIEHIASSHRISKKLSSRATSVFFPVGVLAVGGF